MLSRLYIRNYAIIEELDLNIDKGLTIITGETGAGKSIILGALSLIMGQRADTSILNEDSGKCIVEGFFQIERYNMEPLFERYDLDCEPETSIRREITASGKSRAFINDTPVNLKTLKAISEQLIDIHSQHQSLQISNPEFQLGVIDIYSGNGDRLEKYKSKFTEWQTEKRLLSNMITNRDQISQELDYYQFQFNQLEEANLEEGEQEKLEAEQTLLNNAEEIKRTLESVSLALDSSEGGVIEVLGGLNRSINKIASYIEESDLETRLNSCLIELRDIASEASSLEENIDYSSQRVSEIEERLDLIYSLQTKNRVSSIEELIALKITFKEKIAGVESADNSVEELTAKVKVLEDSLMAMAQEISNIRESKRHEIETQVEKFVSSLGIPYATIEIKMVQTESLTPTGIDSVTFLFTGNRGKDPNDISKVASGGEISRVMLAIKYLISTKTSLPTVIFDEIDTGVSGEVAGKMGDILKRLGKEMQVLSITHLPQIAAKGDNHLFVYKQHLETGTITNIRTLSHEERVGEIAKMLSGDGVSASARQNALELLKQ